MRSGFRTLQEMDLDELGLDVVDELMGEVFVIQHR